MEDSVWEEMMKRNDVCPNLALNTELSKLRPPELASAEEFKNVKDKQHLLEE